ncbi:TRAP-type transport system [Vibrio ishigakensis]|uniref:TRAP transporter small permease protein n=1 Tax=Vibrio ishigakensis TaxID=1481914 RepID=A0A0B8PDT2_9VIBR|nr:TRAP-type transport system [Vibrio ishigakensis]
MFFGYSLIGLLNPFWVNLMKRLINWLDKLVNLVAIASMLTMVVLVFMNVVLRYAFDSGLPWSEEASRIAFVWVVFLGIIIANRDNSHLRVDILVSRLGNLGQKISGFIAGIVTVLVLVSVLIGGSKLIALTRSRPSSYGHSNLCHLHRWRHVLHHSAYRYLYQTI